MAVETKKTTYMKLPKPQRMRIVLKVGFDETATSKDGTAVWLYAMRNNYGMPSSTTTTKNGKTRKSPAVPERPFFSQGGKLFEHDAVEALKGIYSAIIKDPEKVKKSFRILGLLWVSKIQKAIRDTTTPPNTPYTIKKKGGKTHPLIDTGLMLRSVKSEVE